MAHKRHVYKQFFSLVSFNWLWRRPSFQVVGRCRRKSCPSTYRLRFTIVQSRYFQVWNKLFGALWRWPIKRGQPFFHTSIYIQQQEIVRRQLNSWMCIQSFWWHSKSRTQETTIYIKLVKVNESILTYNFYLDFDSLSVYDYKIGHRAPANLATASYRIIHIFVLGCIVIRSSTTLL